MPLVPYLLTLALEKVYRSSSTPTIPTELDNDRVFLSASYAMELRLTF